MVEHAHLGTTRYTTDSLVVIQVPGKPMETSSIHCDFVAGSTRGCNSPLKGAKIIRSFRMSCLQYHLILDYRERLNYCKGLMAKICFLLLCHKNPEQIVEQAEMLTDSGDFVSIHFDRRGRPAGFLTINEALEDNQNICFAQRVKCG